MACDHQALVELARAEVWRAIDVQAELLLAAVCPACAAPCSVHVMADADSWFVVIATVGTFGACSLAPTPSIRQPFCTRDGGHQELGRR